ncbi:MAG: hypothetical protein WC635_05455 [Bacteriovorax sp.]|jgi:hypothetical protein
MANKKSEKDETKSEESTTANVKKEPQEKKSFIQAYQEKISTVANSEDLTSIIFEILWDKDRNFDKEIVPATKETIKKYFELEFSGAENGDLLSNYWIVFLWTNQSINPYHLDAIYRSVYRHNVDHTNGHVGKKDVLAVLQSPGGSIVPAYKISKLCKELSKSKFAVAIPRSAKSAATLISLGADEIHMGYLSELGPIDPQISGWPALGVQDAFRKIALIVKDIPESKDLFESYIKSIPLPSFGWLTRVPESAVQYGQKLLIMGSMKGQVDAAGKIAHKLVHEYKDHSFVIDREEAKEIFGKDELIKEHSKEIESSERFYEQISRLEMVLSVLWSSDDSKIKIEIVGDIDNGISIVDRKED